MDLLITLIWLLPKFTCINVSLSFINIYSYCISIKEKVNIDDEGKKPIYFSLIRKNIYEIFSITKSLRCNVYYYRKGNSL